MPKVLVRAKGSQTKQSVQRGAFWRYCNVAANGAISRARQRGLPCEIDAYAIDRMLVDQGWRCAISNMPLEARGDHGPFGPSLDRIVPALGYVPGNIRVVCNMANWAMNRWGEEPLRAFINALRKSK